MDNIPGMFLKTLVDSNITPSEDESGCNVHS